MTSFSDAMKKDECNTKNKICRKWKAFRVDLPEEDRRCVSVTICKFSKLHLFRILTLFSKCCLMNNFSSQTKVFFASAHNYYTNSTDGLFDIPELLTLPVEISLWIVDNFLTVLTTFFMASNLRNKSICENYKIRYSWLIYQKTIQNECQLLFARYQI